jgi:hypothetical protein
MAGALSARPLGAPLSSWLLVAAAGTVAVTAVGMIGGLVHAQGSIAELRAATRTNESTARQLGAGLAEANRRLEAAGEAPVPVPQVSIVAGPAGAAGLQGPVGAAGLVGPVGASGAPGAVGAPGPAGQAGTDGSAGADGQPGPAGPVGAQGDPGPAGVQGQPGTDGAGGEPPLSWAFTVGDTTYTCTRADPFDPAAPTYTCPATDPVPGPR